MSESLSPEAKSSPEVKPKPKPRRRRWKWIILTVLVLFALFACCAGWTAANRQWIRHQSEREYTRARAEVEQTEPDWSWERLNALRKQPPSGKNAAELVPQIKSRTNREWGKELSNEKWKPLLDVPPNFHYPPSVITEVRRDLDASSDAVKLARTLKDFPYGHREIHLKPDVLSTLLEDTQNTRHVADLLRWDVITAIEDGDFTRAAIDLRAMLNASRSIGDEPCLISQLVRMAVRDVMIRHTERFLAHSTDVAQLSELQTALAADAEEPLLLYGLLGERAMFDRLFENLDNGTAALDESLDGSKGDPKARIGWWLYRAHLPADRAEFLRMITACIEASRLPVHEQPAAFAAIQLPPKDTKLILTRLLFPAIDKVAQGHCRSTAEARCAVVGISCERFRQKHGRWPNELAELAPTFIPAVPLDPYDGLPLKYVKLNDGVAVHSVGTRPPSGFPNSFKPRPELPEGIEFGFRLWNPDQRRLPPRPDPLPPEGEPMP